jgi:hypothetical protein
MAVFSFCESIVLILYLEIERENKESTGEFLWNTYTFLAYTNLM